LRLLSLSGLLSAYPAAHRPSTSMSIMRWATYWIISRSRSASAPFSVSSVSAIFVLVVIVVSSVEVDGLVTTTLTRNHDGRLAPRPAGRVASTALRLKAWIRRSLVHHSPGRQRVLK